ncbi:hypothetical protein ScPMuIL_010196 [Solemya velum]
MLKLFNVLSVLSLTSILILSTLPGIKAQATLDVVETFQGTTKEQESTNGVILDCQENDETCTQDKAGLEAIRTLHRNIDDDNNGNVDPSESDEFMRDELQYTDGFERQSIFHGNDKLISVGDLWQAWRKSAVYNWTVDDVTEWLEFCIELPQYVQIFKQNAVGGPRMPRLAVNDQHYMTVILGIKNPVHRQKLSLKATDVVLFGPPKKDGHSFKKDIALATSLLVAIGGFWIAYIQNKRAQLQVKKMIKDMDSLQKAGESLSDLQVKLEKAQEDQLTAAQEKKKLEEKYREDVMLAKKEAERLKHARESTTTEENSRLFLAEEELAQVRGALRKTEKELELRAYSASPTELQAWLQLTHELELLHFNVKRQAAERQFSIVKEGCEKIRKKRTAFLGSLRMAHNNSIDDIDQRIVAARNAMEEVRQDLQERLQRWNNIEEICGFPIVSNPGLIALKQALQRDSGSGRTTASMIAPLTVDEADEDLPPAYPTATAMILHSSVNGFTRPPPPYPVYAPATKPQMEVIHRPHTLHTSGSLSRLPVSTHMTEHRHSESPISGSSIGNVSFHLGERTPVSPNVELSGSKQDVLDNMYRKSNLLTAGSTSLPKSLSFSTAQSSNHMKNGTENTGNTFSNNKVNDKRCSSEANVLNCNPEAMDNENSGTESTGSDEKKKKNKEEKITCFCKNFKER